MEHSHQHNNIPTMFSVVQTINVNQVAGMDPNALTHVVDIMFINQILKDDVSVKQ